MTNIGHAVTQRVEAKASFRRAVSVGLREKSTKDLSRIQTSGLDTGAAFLQAIYISSTGPVEIVEEHEASHLFVVFN